MPSDWRRSSLLVQWAVPVSPGRWTFLAALILPVLVAQAWKGFWSGVWTAVAVWAGSWLLWGSGLGWAPAGVALLISLGVTGHASGYLPPGGRGAAGMAGGRGRPGRPTALAQRRDRGIPQLRGVRAGSRVGVVVLSNSANDVDPIGMALLKALHEARRPRDEGSEEHLRREMPPVGSSRDQGFRRGSDSTSAGTRMKAEELRARVFAELEAIGFRPARSLPLPDTGRHLRPAGGDRRPPAAALDALFTRVAFSEEDVDSGRIESHVERNGLRGSADRGRAGDRLASGAEAHESHVDAIGWKLENMWSLAWALGFEPGRRSSLQIRDDITRWMSYDFLPGLGHTVVDLLARAAPRPAEGVIALEYRCLLRHDAVRGAQLGGKRCPGDSTRSPTAARSMNGVMR